MSQEVTGMTAFWAVLALALNAMARPSYTSRLLYGHGKKAETSLIPHLSSPIICLVDFLLELVVLAKMLYKACLGPKKREPVSESPISTQKTRKDSIAVRMVLFILGGLPQAIKISGMRRIPITQTISFIFLASTAIGAVTEVFQERAEIEKDEIEAWLKANQRKADLVGGLVLAMHVVASIMTWWSISQNIVLHRTDTNGPFVDLCLWVTVIATFLSVLITLIWILGIFFAPLTSARLLRIRVSPIIACLPIMVLFFYPTRLQEGDRAKTREHDKNTLQTIVWNIAPILLVVCLGSYILAAVLVRISHILAGTEAGDDSPQHESTLSADGNEESHREPNPSDVAISNDTEDETDPDPVEDLLKTGSITLLLPFAKALRATEDKTRPNGEPIGNGSQTTTTTLNSATPNPTGSLSNNSSAPQNPSSTSSQPPVTARRQHSTHLKRRMSTTQWNWFLVAYSFRNFRNKIPGAMSHQWKATTGPSHRRLMACIHLAGRILWLFVLQAIMFGIFAGLNILDFSPVDRLCARIAKKAGPGTGWVFFAIFNLATAVGYYALPFDGTGTVNAGWTGVLGRRA